MKSRFKLTLDRRIQYLLATVCLFFLIGILMSLKLWLTNRHFAHAPVGGFFPVLPAPIDFILLGLSIVGMVWTMFRQHRWVVIGLLLLLLLILLQDQMRWQPWVFMYTLLLLPFALIDDRRLKKNDPVFLNCIQIILIGMYLWGGLHKFTPSFFSVTFPNILTGLFKITDETLISKLSWLGYLIPVIEVFIAISLLVKKNRNLTVFLAIGTHLLILAYLSPLGINHNTIVYPWNIALMVFVFLAFYNYDKKIECWPKQHRFAVVISILFACILPGLNLINKWDDYLSFNLYTGNREDLYIIIPDKVVTNLPDRIQPFVYEITDKEGVQSINVNRWSLDELNVPVNPEQRVFDQISKNYCSRLGQNHNPVFFEITRIEPRIIKRQYYCKDLQ